MSRLSTHDSTLRLRSRLDDYQAFDTTGEIHGIADCCVLALVLRADDADHCGAGMDADADIEALSQLAQLTLEFLERLRHLERRHHRVPGVIGIVQRRAPEGHDGIADELVQATAVPKNDLDLTPEV